MDCIFCDIIAGKAPSHIIWEDELHVAFLSIYPNTEGLTVVIPKQHHPSYIFDCDDQVITQLMLASKKVAEILDSKLDNVGRTGVVFEGFGVNHLHCKLIPMHGTASMNEWRAISSTENKYFARYEGYLSSHDSDRASDEELSQLATRLRA